MNLPQLPNRPILLTTTVPVPVGAVREPQDKYALQPAFNEALLLDEIRFDYLQPATGLGAQGINPWNDIRVELTMGGSISFTYQPVPLSALNTSPNPYLWNYSYNSVVFRLPKPLYLNPGDMFVPRFHNNWINDVNIQVTYAARRTPVRPSENWYPYITSYTSQQFNVLPSTDSFLLESTPSDLVNPYDVPLLVDRLVGFIGTNSTFGGFILGPIKRNPCDYAGDYLNVRLFDSAERPIVRDLTPFNMLFNLQGRAWQMKSILHPHEYYIAQISYENNAAQYYDPPLLPPPGRQPSSMAANIVMIGSRRADAKYTDRRLDSLDIPTKFGPAKVRPDWNLPKLKKG